MTAILIGPPPTTADSSPESVRFDGHKVPVLHWLTSLLGLGPIPFTWLKFTRALMCEQRRMGILRPADRFSQHEKYIYSMAEESASRLELGGVRTLARLGEKIDNLSAEIAGLEAEVGLNEQDPLVGPRRELLTVQAASSRHDQLVEKVITEEAAGSLKHRRVSEAELKSAKRQTLLDFPILLFFAAMLTNLDWGGLVIVDEALTGNLFRLLVALVMASLGTWGLASALASFATRLTVYKDDQGHLALPRGVAGIEAFLYLGLTVAAVAGAAAVMAYRILADADGFGLGKGGARLLAFFFAAIVAMINTKVFTTFLRDGSCLTQDIQLLAGALEPVRKAQQRLRRRVAHLEPQRNLLLARADRIVITTETAVDKVWTVAEQVLLLARSYHMGAGWEGVLPARPDVELKALKNMRDSLDRPGPGSDTEAGAQLFPNGKEAVALVRLVISRVTAVATGGQHGGDQS